MKNIMYKIGMWLVKKSGMDKSIDIHKMNDTAIANELIVRASDVELDINSTKSEQLLTAIIKSSKNKIVDFIIK